MDQRGSRGYMRVLQDWFNRSLIFTRLLLLLYFLCRLRSCGVIFFFFLFCGSGFSFFFFYRVGGIFVLQSCFSFTTSNMYYSYWTLLLGPSSWSLLTFILNLTPVLYFYPLVVYEIMIDSAESGVQPMSCRPND